MIPAEAVAGVAIVLGAGSAMWHGMPVSEPSGNPLELVTHPVETLFGVDVE